MSPKANDCPMPSSGPSRRNARGPKISRSQRAGLILPVGRIGGMLHRGHYSARISNSAPIAMAAVLEYLAFEILDLAGRINPQKTRIIPRHIFLAIRGDEELDELFTSCKDATIREAGVVPGLVMPYQRPKAMKAHRNQGRGKSGKSGMDSGHSSMNDSGTGAHQPDC